MEIVEAKVAVHFSFGRHTYFDVPLLPQIRQQAEEFWGPVGTNRNVYWKEDLGASETLMRRFRNLTAEGIGLLDAYIQADHLTNPSVRRRLEPEELANARRFLLLSDGSTGDSETDSQVAQAVFLRREYLMLDDIGKTRPFILIPETCPDPVAKTRIKQSEELSQKLRSIRTILRQGSIPSQALRSYRESVIQNIANSSRERNVACLDTLVGLVREGQKANQGTRIFVRIGEVHFPLVERLGERLRKASLEAAVTHTYDYGELGLLPENKLVAALEANPKATFSRDEWISALIGETIEDHLTNARRPRPEVVRNVKRTLDSSTPEELESLVASFPKDGMENAIGRFTASKIF